jgi:hypothetical protein
MTLKLEVKMIIDKKLERSLDRNVFENAIGVMKKYGVSSILSKRILPKKDRIRSSLLVYYESTEEYEKCQFIKEFFEQLETEIDKEISPEELEQKTN